jgi:exopolysaccharide biosynthesis protein
MKSQQRQQMNRRVQNHDQVKQNDAQHTALQHHRVVEKIEKVHQHQQQQISKTNGNQRVVHQQRPNQHQQHLQQRPQQQQVQQQQQIPNPHSKSFLFSNER